MGQRASSIKEVQPQRPPAAIMQATDGVIIRTIDEQTQQVDYHFQPQNVPRLSLTQVQDTGYVSKLQQLPVQMARVGVNNQTMKNKLVYIKKRSSASPH